MTSKTSRAVMVWEHAAIARYPRSETLMVSREGVLTYRPVPTNYIRSFPRSTLPKPNYSPVLLPIQRKLIELGDAAIPTPPNETAIRNAGVVALALSIEDRLKPDRIVPSSEGGIVFYFFGEKKLEGGSHARFASISCSNEGEIVAMLSERSGATDAWELYSDRNIREALRGKMHNSLLIDASCGRLILRFRPTSRCTALCGTIGSTETRSFPRPSSFRVFGRSLVLYTPSGRPLTPPGLHPRCPSS